MSRRTPLPFELGTAFRVGAALDAGASRSRLRSRDLSTPTHGVRVRVSMTEESALPEWQRDERRSDLRRRAKETAPALLDSQFFSHETALILAGCPMPLRPYEPRLHVSALRPAGMPRRKEWSGHRLQARDPAVGEIDGVRSEHPVRAWRQAATLWSLDDLVAAADYLVHPRRRLATIEELGAEVRTMGDVPARTLTRAVALVRLGAESPEETSLRLLLGRSGLPEPRLNHELRTPAGLLIARLDLSYERYRVAVEYDGRVHAEDAEQFRRDADRWDAIRAAGWQHVRILSHHVRPDPRVAVQKVAAALLSAGWLPGL